VGWFSVGDDPPSRGVPCLTSLRGLSGHFSAHALKAADSLLFKQSLYGHSAEID
jgi:hypothetical protein